ncbi:hypothetical protein GY45DRAFT_1324484 [Cubamyces sp. BRFM 1775]|nr:hypothetical protein GY45DRAFT_1324484 [Cubamyces sp. BRFM 1775]
MSTLNGPPTPLTPIERALKASILDQEFRDVQLYAFTRRTTYSDGTIRIGHPLSLHAVGSVLKETEHFSTLLSSGFAESNSADGVVIRQYASEDEYDYESDSDLGDTEEAEDPLKRPSTSSAPSIAVSVAGTKGKSKDSEARSSETYPTREFGKSQSIIQIPSVAYRTLSACIFFLYTGKVNFLPLRSQGMSARQFALFTSSDTGAPPCSPKSMFRLAESYGMTTLQDIAYKAIIERLTPENVVIEAFSRYFSRYDQLREHAVSYMMQHYHEQSIQTSLSRVLDDLLLGQTPHAGPSLRSLLALRVATAMSLPNQATPSDSVRSPGTTTPSPPSGYPFQWLSCSAIPTTSPVAPTTLRPQQSSWLANAAPTAIPTWAPTAVSTSSWAPTAIPTSLRTASATPEQAPKDELSAVGDDREDRSDAGMLPEYVSTDGHSLAKGGQSKKGKKGKKYS